MIDQLADKRLVVVTGKGGVGKTTMAAALALESARSGLRTLVCEINTKERVTHLLGHADVGPTVTAIDENLWAVNVRPEEALREYAMMILKFESIYNAVFENRLVKYFLRFVPSIQEVVLLGKPLFHLREKRPDGSWRFDRVIIDAPATGHAITFLSIPQVILDTVPPGALADDARWMRDCLVDEKTCAVVLVSLPEDMPVNETLELHQALTTRVKVHPRLVVLNGAVSSRFVDADRAHVPPSIAHVIDGHLAREALTQRSLKTLATLGLPMISVERVYGASFGRQAIERIATRFAGAPR